MENDRLYNLGEEIISLENEREVLREGIGVIEKIFQKKLYIQPKTIEDLTTFFLTDEEDLVFCPEKEKEIQRILNDYREIIDDDEKYELYQKIVNLLILLNETPRDYFPHLERLKILKLKAQTKLESVERKLKEKEAEMEKLGKSFS